MKEDSSVLQSSGLDSDAGMTRWKAGLVFFKSAFVVLTGDASKGASLSPASSGENTVSGSWTKLVLVNLDVVGIYAIQLELSNTFSEGLTMVMPELFHPHTMRRTQMRDKMTTVLLRRVFARRINMG